MSRGRRVPQSHGGGSSQSNPVLSALQNIFDLDIHRKPNGTFTFDMGGVEWNAPFPSELDAIAGALMHIRDVYDQQSGAQSVGQAIEAYFAKDGLTITKYEGGWLAHWQDAEHPVDPMQYYERTGRPRKLYATRDEAVIAGIEQGEENLIENRTAAVWETYLTLSMAIEKIIGATVHETTGGDGKLTGRWVYAFGETVSTQAYASDAEAVSAALEAYITTHRLRPRPHGHVGDPPAGVTITLTAPSATGAVYDIIQDDDAYVLCPVCGFDYVHEGIPYTVKGNDHGDAWEGRGDLIVVPFDGECGHTWELCFGHHKGQTTAFVRNINKDETRP